MAATSYKEGYFPPDICRSNQLCIGLGQNLVKLIASTLFHEIMIDVNTFNFIPCLARPIACYVKGTEPCVASIPNELAGTFSLPPIFPMCLREEGRQRKHRCGEVLMWSEPSSSACQSITWGTNSQGPWELEAKFGPQWREVVLLVVVG